jgi:hypothetical protein
MKSNRANVAIPIRPQESPNTGSTFNLLLPSKSSHEKVEVAEQKVPPSLIFDEIQRVCVETAKPAIEINCKPESNLPLAVCKEGNFSAIDEVSKLPQGDTIRNPINVGIRYTATKALDDKSSTLPWD